MALCYRVSLLGADFVMKVTESGYMDTQGFSVPDPVFPPG